MTEIPDFEDLGALEVRIARLEEQYQTILQELLCKHTKRVAHEAWDGNGKQSDDRCETYVQCLGCHKVLETVGPHKIGEGPRRLQDRFVNKIREKDYMRNRR